MASFRSVGTGTSTENPITITKPAGLTAGDLMIAYIGINGATAGFTSSGWTEIETANPGSSNLGVTALWKIADSSDVAASNFSFTQGGSPTENLIGMIVAVSGTFAGSGNFVHDIAFDQDIGDNDIAEFTGSVTPLAANSLILFFVTGELVNEATSSLSGWALSPNDISWTEATEVSNSNNNDQRGGIAYGTRTEITEITAFQVDFNGSSNLGDSLGMIISIIDSTDVTTNVDAPGVLTLSQGGSHDINLDFTVAIDSPGTLTLNGPVATTDTQEYEVYSDQSKSSTSWSNQSK